MNMYHEILLIACITATACTIPGVFLVSKGSALISDAISHSILLGMVLAFLWVQDISSGWIFIGALLSGMATVALTQWLSNAKYVHQDAALGLVFPLFFSIAVILINIYASSIHLDTDAILLGDLVFAPFHRLIIQGIDYGPITLWNMSFILLINVIGIIMFYKELLISIFDQDYAHSISYNPTLFHYALMLLTSITIIGAFDTVGSVLVISFIIVPAATAHLLSHNIKKVIIHAVGLSISSAITGFALAQYTQGSIAGAITFIQGILFFAVLLARSKKA